MKRTEIFNLKTAKKIMELYPNTQLKLDYYGKGWYVLRDGWARAQLWDDGDICMNSALGEDPFPVYNISEL